MISMEQLVLECDVFMKRLDRICSLNKPPKDYIGLVSTRLIENHNNKQNAFRDDQQMRFSNSRENQQSKLKQQVESVYEVDSLKARSGGKERYQKDNLEQGMEMVSNRNFEIIMKEKQKSAESERKSQLHQSPYENKHRYKEMQQREQQQQLKEKNDEEMRGFSGERMKIRNGFEGQYFSTPEENQLRKRSSRAGSGNKQEQEQAAWIDTNKNMMTLNQNQNGNGKEFREMNKNIIDEQNIPHASIGRELYQMSNQVDGLQQGGQKQSNREQRRDKDYSNHQNQVQGNNAIQENIQKMEQSAEKISAKPERNYWTRLDRIPNSSRKETVSLNVKQEALIVKKEESQSQQEDIFIENYTNRQSHIQQSSREWSDIEVEQLGIVLNSEPILVENPMLSFQKIASAFNQAIGQLSKQNSNNQKLHVRTQQEIIEKLRADAKVVYTNERKKHDSIYKNLMELSRTAR